MRLAFLSVCVLLVGCQDGIKVDAGEDSFCDEYAEVACYNMYRCCSERLIEQELGVSEPRTEEQCREDKRRNCERSSASLRDSLAAGRVTFQAAAFNECLSSIVAPDDTCSTYVTELPWEAPCEAQVWVGTVGMGGACFFDHDCVGYPKSAECGPDQKCMMLPTSGFPCPTNQCAEGFFCGPNAICTAQLAEGAPCTNSNQCKEELFCDITATPTPVCASRKPGGSPCTTPLGCVSGECVPGRCAISNTTCFSDATCGGHCADDNSGCTVGSDYMCNTSGFCSVVTSQPCSGSLADSYCSNNGYGPKCNFNVACVPTDCVGDPVCTAPLFLADYCTAGLGLTP